MANYQKYTRDGLYGLLRHISREKKSNGEYFKHSNESIDPRLTFANYDLSSRYEDGSQQYDRIKRRLDELQFRKQKNNIVCCSWLITAPKDVKSNDTEKFFVAARGFLLDKYGAENEVSAYVHMDETTPHMHWTFVPATKDGHLRASHVVTRDELKRFHPQMETYIEQELGYHVQLCDPDRDKRMKGKSKSIKELKVEAAKADERLQKARQQLNIAQDLQENLDIYETIVNKYGSFKGALDTLEELEHMLGKNVP